MPVPRRQWWRCCPRSGWTCKRISPTPRRRSSDGARQPTLPTRRSLQLLPPPSQSPAFPPHRLAPPLSRWARPSPQLPTRIPRRFPGHSDAARQAAAAAMRLRWSAISHMCRGPWHFITAAALDEVPAGQRRQMMHHAAVLSQLTHLAAAVGAGAIAGLLPLPLHRCHCSSTARCCDADGRAAPLAPMRHKQQPACPATLPPCTSSTMLADASERSPTGHRHTPQHCSLSERSAGSWQAAPQRHTA